MLKRLFLKYAIQAVYDPCRLEPPRPSTAATNGGSAERFPVSEYPSFRVAMKLLGLALRCHSPALNDQERRLLRETGPPPSSSFPPPPLSSSWWW